MRRYWFAFIVGYLPVIEDKDPPWYPFMKKYVDGHECDVDGNRIYRGFVDALNDQEAYKLVMEIKRGVQK